MIKPLAHSFSPSLVSKLSLFLSLPVCPQSSLLTAKGGGGARSQIIQPEKAWSSINHSILSASSSLTTAEPVFVNVYGGQESIPQAHEAWRAGTTNRVVVPVCQAGNRFLGSLKGLQIRAQYGRYCIS
jgi:hypothetical protein